VEKHRIVKNDHFATFVIPLRSSTFRLTNVDNPTLLSCSSSHNVEEICSHLQNTKEVVVPSRQDFVNKCKIVNDKIGSIVRAVEAICSFPTENARSN